MPKKNEERVVIVKDGPYLVLGGVPLAKEISIRDHKKVPAEWKLGKKYPDQENYSLCRCGASMNKPFCDGSHTTNRFDGSETASKQPFSEVAERYEGPGLAMLDNEVLCARAQFCHRAGGIWDLVEVAEDPMTKALAIEIVGQCPTRGNR
jgi:CDGSH-type Zn-finger protein